MTATLSRAEELRNDLDNLIFTKKYLIGVLAELEDLGRTHSAEFQQAEANLRAINNNISRIKKELETEEKRTFDEEIIDPYYFSDGMHW